MFTRWVMNYEGQVSFKEFKETLMAQSTTIVETEEETLDRIKNIMDAFNKKGGD